MPKEDHGMPHEAAHNDQCGIAKSIGIGKMINMKETKQQEEDSREERNSLVTS
jgi:hypothetical protein